MFSYSKLPSRPFRHHNAMGGLWSAPFEIPLRGAVVADRQPHQTSRFSYVRQLHLEALGYCGLHSFARNPGYRADYLQLPSTAPVRDKINDGCSAIQNAARAGRFSSMPAIRSEKLIGLARNGWPWIRRPDLVSVFVTRAVRKTIGVVCNVGSA